MNKAIWMQLAFAAGVSTIAVPAAADPPVGTITTFAGDIKDTPCVSPEGLSVDLQGNFYTGSAQTKSTGAVCQFGPNGAFKKSFTIPPAKSGGVVSLLGVLFQPPHTVFALDFADALAGPPDQAPPTDGRVLAVNTETGAVTTIASGFVFPNGIAEDLDGFFYVADSLQATVTRFKADGSQKSVWYSSSLLAPGTGQPPLGANGIAFDFLFRNVYVSNTSNQQIIRIPVEHDGSAGTAVVFADGATINNNQRTTGALNGADGIAFDLFGNLYVAANQANEIQVISPNGQLAARYSSTTLTLDNPASLVFIGDELYFTNASIFDGGGNSAIFVLEAPLPGLPPLPL
jgi:sugar lactone lactonase YvrE